MRFRIAFLYLGAGCAMGAAFLLNQLWILGLFGIVVLFVAISRTRMQWDAFFGGWVAGTLKMLLVLFWFWDTAPLDWLGLSAFSSKLLIFAYWSVTCLVIGLGLGVASVGVWYLLKQRTVWWQAFIPLAFVGGEVLGSLFFAGYAVGPGSGINIDFSYGYTGYLLNNHGIFRYLAAVGGVYILSACAAVLALLVFWAWGTLRRQWYGAGIIALVLATSGIDIGKSSTSALLLHERVALIGTSFSSDTNTSYAEFSKKQEMARQAVTAAFASHPGYVVLPEDTRLTYGTTTAATFSWLQSIGNVEGRTVLIDSYRTIDFGRTILRAYAYALPERELYTFDKRYLVPQGEYVPYFLGLILAATGHEAELAHLLENTNYVPGEPNALDIPTHIPGILFCFESASPKSAWLLARERSVPFIVHPVSHAWFRDSALLEHELQEMLMVEALTAKTMILQAGNQAPNMAIDRRGRIVLPESTEILPGITIDFYDL